MFYNLEKCIDGEWYLWAAYGVSEIDALVQAVWMFGRTGIPVRIRVTDSREDSEMPFDW